MLLQSVEGCEGRSGLVLLDGAFCGWHLYWNGWPGTSLFLCALLARLDIGLLSVVDAKLLFCFTSLHSLPAPRTDSC